MVPKPVVDQRMSKDWASTIPIGILIPILLNTLCYWSVWSELVGVSRYDGQYTGLKADCYGVGDRYLNPWGRACINVWTEDRQTFNTIRTISSRLVYLGLLHDSASTPRCGLEESESSRGLAVGIRLRSAIGSDPDASEQEYRQYHVSGFRHDGDLHDVDRLVTGANNA